MKGNPLPLLKNPLFTGVYTRFIVLLLYMSCCKYPKNAKTCKRTTDGKIFDLPRRFTRKQCANVRGFTMRSSCAPYKGCGGGKLSRQAVAVLAENNNGITGKSRKLLFNLIFRKSSFYLPNSPKIGKEETVSPRW